MALSRRQGHGDFMLYVKPMAGAAPRIKVAVRPWATVLDLKEKVCRAVLSDGTPASRTRLFCRGRELVDHQSLAEAKVRRRDLVYVDTVSDEDLRGDAVLLSLHLSDTLLGLEPPEELVACYEAARGGIAAGHAPVLAADGTGGTYFFPDASKRFVAAFKPGDEEPFCVNNPRGYARGNGSAESMRAGIRPGEAHYREVAAFYLDEGGFTGVPAATLAEARHTAFSNLAGEEATQRKMGSLQAFVPHDAVVEDGDERFLPVNEVHRIAMFDMRLLNGDRNNENILVVRNLPRPTRLRSLSETAATPSPSPPAGSPACSFDSLDLGASCPSPGSVLSRETVGGLNGKPGAVTPWDVQLVPIDHGFCLPERLEIGWCDWTWLEWPQLKQPLSEENRAHLLSLDPFAEAARLEKVLPIRDTALRNMIAAGLLLREGVAAGLTLYDIANIIARQDLDTPSELEAILVLAERHAHRALRRQGRYGSRPFQRRTFDFGGPGDAAQFTDDVEQLCQGLPSPTGRTSRDSRRSTGTLVEFAAGSRVTTPGVRRKGAKLRPWAGMSLSRVASYGGFLSLGMEDEKAAPLAPGQGSATPSPIRPSISQLHLVQSEDTSGSPQPGGPLVRAAAVEPHAEVGSESPLGMLSGRGMPLARLQSEALPPRLHLPMAPTGAADLRVPSPVAEDVESPMNGSTGGKDFDHFFFGAVELHLRPLVERKRKLREEVQQAERDCNERRSEGRVELQSQRSAEERTLTAVGSSLVESVAPSPVWGV